MSLLAAVVEGICSVLEGMVRVLEDLVLVAAGLRGPELARWPRVPWGMDNLGFGAFLALALFGFVVMLGMRGSDTVHVSLEECTETCKGDVWSWSAFDCKCDCR